MFFDCLFAKTIKKEKRLPIFVLPLLNSLQNGEAQKFEVLWLSPFSVEKFNWDTTFTYSSEIYEYFLPYNHYITPW